jgi:hypothetical protein
MTIAERGTPGTRPAIIAGRSSEPIRPDLPAGLSSSVRIKPLDCFARVV